MTGTKPDYERLSECSSDACFRLIFGQGLTHVNNGFLRMTGYSEVEVLRRPNFFNRLIQPSGLEEFLATEERLREGREEMASLVTRMADKKGRMLWVEMFLITAMDETGQVIGIDGYARDVSQHLQLAYRLRRRTREQIVLLQVQRELLTQLELPQSMELIVEKARTLLNASDCTLYLLESDEETLIPVASSGQYADQMMDMQLRVGEGLAGWVVEHGKPQRVDHSLTDHRTVQVDGTPVGDESLLCAPLHIGDRVSGALLLGRGPGQFNDQDLDLLVALAQVVSLTVANTQLFSEVQRLATVDDLTGAFNRNYLNAHLENELNRARRLGYPLGLLIVDVDDLKKVNDRHGHLAGDELLKLVVCVLKESIRETDWVARYGGDEFAVVLPGCSADQLLGIGKKLQSSMAGKLLELPKGRSIELSVSIGGTAYPEDVENVNDLVRVADQAELEAKQAGGNRVVVRSTGAGQLHSGREVVGSE
ncbi:MAG: diguanylate cyclase [Anaerolineales bacterium]|nr:MAG: diguanylate cyclase [Anaerolineales bacterium]